MSLPISSTSGEGDCCGAIGCLPCTEENNTYTILIIMTPGEIPVHRGAELADIMKTLIQQIT